MEVLHSPPRADGIRRNGRREVHRFRGFGYRAKHDVAELEK